MAKLQQCNRWCLEWMSDFITHFTGHVITYPRWDSSWSMIVNIFADVWQRKYCHNEQQWRHHTTLSGCCARGFIIHTQIGHEGHCWVRCVMTLPRKGHCWVRCVMTLPRNDTTIKGIFTSHGKKSSKGLSVFTKWQDPCFLCHTHFQHLGFNSLGPSDTYMRR